MTEQELKQLLESKENELLELMSKPGFHDNSRFVELQTEIFNIRFYLETEVAA